MPGGSTTGAPDWRDAAKLRKFLADDIPQWTPSEGAENTRAFLAALREKCSTEIGAMTGLLLALFEERVDASKAGYELAQKLKRAGERRLCLWQVVEAEASADIECWCGVAWAVGVCA